MVRDCAGHTWTYDPAHRRWFVADTRLVVYVGDKGSDGRTSTWLDGGGAEYPSLVMAMSEEADYYRRTKAYVDTIISHDIRLRLGRVVLANDVLMYLLLLTSAGCAMGWAR